MRNGFTLPAHAVGSRTGTPPETSGCQCPGAGFDTHGDGPNRPSPSLSSSIASAAACPTLMPCFLKESSSIASSEAAYSEASVFRSAPRLVNGTLSCAVETSSESTTYAAVATAASIDAFAPARLLSRYGRCCFGPIALAASYTAPCTMPMFIWKAGGAPPFGPGNAASVVAATWFQ